MTTRVQLDGPGPHTLPEAEGFLGLVLAQGRSPVQMRFVLTDGSELHLPIADYAFGKVLEQFAALHAARQKDQ